MSILGLPIIGDLIGAAKDIASEAITDKDKRAELNFKLEELRDRVNEREFELAKGQIEVNKVEAGSEKIFVAGWRPAVGWISVFALAYMFIIMPFMSFIARVGLHYEGTFPVINGTEHLMFLLVGMLGIGGMRTLEKIKGVSSDTIADSPASARNAPQPTQLIPPGFGPPPEDAPWR